MSIFLKILSAPFKLPVELSRGWNRAIDWVKGRDSNAKNEEGRTALMSTAKEGITKSVKSMIEKDHANVRATDNEGRTALMYALASESREAKGCLKVLLKAGSDINAETKDGDTPLILAAGTNKLDCVEVLLKAKPNVNAKNKDGWTALMVAAASGNSDCLNALLKAKAEVDMKNNDSETALLLAVRSGSGDCVKALLEAGADTNANDKDGRTILMEAVAKNNVDGVKALLGTKGWLEGVFSRTSAPHVDIHAKDKNGLTALTIAMRKGYSECEDAIRKAESM